MRNECKVWIGFPNGLKLRPERKETLLLSVQKSQKPRREILRDMFKKCLIYSRVRIGPLRKRAPGCCLGESPTKQVSTGIENCTDLTVLPMRLSSVPQSGMDGIISN